MNSKNSLDSSEIELSGKFEYHESIFLFRKKIIPLYFFLTKDKLYFFKEETKTNLFLFINRELVLAICKHHQTFQDVTKFSIFFLDNENSNEISEIKLKTKNIKENEKWIKILKQKIKPKNFFDNEIFTNKINEKISSNYISGDELYQIKDQSEFYLNMCHLEYILLNRKMKRFFEIYKKSIGSNNIDITNNINNKKGNDGTNDNARIIEDNSLTEGECYLIIGEKK